jgi:hypothetical protein
VRGVAEGELLSFSPLSLSTCSPIGSDSASCTWCGRQEAERAYQLWKARQVADQEGSGAVAIRGGRGEGREAQKALVGWVVHGLKRDPFPDLMEFIG